MRATEDAPRGPFRLLECCHGLAEIVAGLGERAQMLEELMGEAGLLHPPPLPQ